MHKIIIIGKNGQLARALHTRAAQFGLQVSHAFGSDDQDLSNSEEDVRAFAAGLPQADGLIIAAAYTQVDKAEEEHKTAHAVNTLAPQIFAQECAKSGIPLVHISTDYVFSGESDRPWKPADKTAPINIYGETKLGGETAVLASNARAVILRTSWVYDGIGHNFLCSMLRLGQVRNELNIVDDQVGRPTYAGHLAEASLTALRKLIDEPDFKGGLFHVSNTGIAISWAEFAKAIFSKASDRLPCKVKVNKILASQYPTAVERPSYSVMDTKLFEKTFGYNIPPWEIGLQAAYKEWLVDQNTGHNNDAK